MMLSIVFGLIAICIGLWGISRFWWYLMDIITGFLPVMLVFVGIVAIISGIRNNGLFVKVVNKEQEPPAAKK
jgi:hypothetical protein